MPDWPFDERPFPILTIAGCFARESLSTAPRTHCRARQVVGELEHLRRLRGKPRGIRVDDGPRVA